MTQTEQSLLVYAGVGLLALVLLKKAADVLSNPTTYTAAADAASNAASAAATGLTAAIGAPPTNQSMCDAAIATGSTITASQYCPAVQFWNYFWSPNPMTIYPAGQTPNTQTAPYIGDNNTPMGNAL